jgi:hypothetical protein
LLVVVEAVRLMVEEEALEGIEPYHFLLSLAQLIH